MSESLGAYPAEQSMAPIDSAPSISFISPAASPSLLRPPPLSKGDTIGVVGPSYAPHGGSLRRGVQAMENAGYKVVLEPEIERFRRFHQNEDRKRAENLMAIWRDPEVKAVICGTGGYGAVRILPYLDADLFRRHPKAFVGYSDITALHLWMMRRAGLRVFHGPTLDDLAPAGVDPTLLSLLAALTTPRPDTNLGREIARAVRPGRAVGRLTGGNLSLVQQTIGTPYEIDTRDAILFLEEIHDPMSVADERLLAPSRRRVATPRARNCVRTPLARPLGGRRVRGFPARPRVGSRCSDPDGFPGGARDTESHSAARHRDGARNG